MEGSLSTTIEAKRKIIVVKGPRGGKGGGTKITAAMDLEDYAKAGGFEQTVDYLISGQIRSVNGRQLITDNRGNGLRVTIRATGVITFACHFTAPPQREDMSEFDADDTPTQGSRPWLKIGSWPKTSVAVARHRAEVITSLARNGINVKWGLEPRLFKELDKQGIRWRPW